MKVLSRISLQCLLTSVVFLATGNAYAGCWIEFQGINSRIVCGETSGPGIDYSTVQIKNKCRYPIRVAATYYSMTCQDYPGNHSCLSEYIPPSERWKTLGWWYLAPGQTKYIADTNSRNVYFYAETNPRTGRSLVWQGNDFVSYIGHKKVSFFKADLGSRMVNYTKAFACPNVRSGSHGSELPHYSSETDVHGPSSAPQHTATNSSDEGGDDWDNPSSGGDDWNDSGRDDDWD